MSEEEIKKLSEAYAECKSPISQFEQVYDKRDNLNESYYKDALSVLEWLSKDYYIVLKNSGTIML